MNDRPQSRKQTRHERIIALLRANPAVRVAELAREFGVSTETVRRDLDELSRVGAVNRTYGGAARSAVGHEAAVNERLQEHVGERERIARHASALVETGDLVMIDGGSTTIHFARQLAALSCRVTAITNSLGVAAALGRDPSSKVVLCPGDYHPSEGIVTGPETIAFLERFFVDKAFIGASGLTRAGPSEVHSSAAWVKRRMLRQAKRSYLLLDSSKFNVLRHELVCPLKEIGELITDRRPGGALRTALAKAEVEVEVVPY
jgi:DeoR/GlpR family transcriptional regulator of sugar metabolism